MNWLKSAIVNLTLIAVSTMITVLMVEIAANIWLKYMADSDSYRRFASLRQLEKRNAAAADPTFRYMQHRYIGFIPTPNYSDLANKHNSLGCRTEEEIPFPKPDGEYRIVCLGGSTTYTGCVSGWMWAYPHQTQVQLHDRGYTHVRVINAGAEAWTSYESLASFELRVLDWDPDCIIVYHGVNDILARFVYPPEAYKGDNSGIRGPNNTGVTMPPIYEHSAIYRIIAVSAGWMLPHGYLGRTIARTQPTDVSSEWYLQVDEGRYPEGIFEEMPVRELFETNAPIYFDRNLRELTSIAEFHDIDVVFATFAYTDTVDQSPFNQEPDFTDNFIVMNDVLRSIANDYDNAHLFDFDSVFPRDPEYWFDVVHVNGDGSELKATYFTDYLVESGLLPPPNS